MSKRFYTHIDLRNNQLLKSVLENIDSTAIGTSGTGRVFWATDLNAPCFWDGSVVREFFYRGQALDPSTITQTGLDATNQEFLVTGIEKAQWNQLYSDSTGFEYLANKNQPDGYAGLDATGKLELSTLLTGMVIQDGTEWKTWGQVLDQPNGIPQLDGTAKLDALVLNQEGYGSSVAALLVSQDDIDNWNSSAIDTTGSELKVNKNQPDGYAGLDGTGKIPHEIQTTGVVIPATKQITFFLDSPGQIGDQVYYTYGNASTLYFSWDTTADTKQTVLDAMRISINSTTGGEVLAMFDGTATLTITAQSVGLDFDMTFGVLGTWTPYTTLITPGYYDMSNIGGVPTIGFAPLNAAGIVDNAYLPDYKDIVVVDTFADMTSISLASRFNGLRVHVVDAEDDPANDDTGWGEYLWVDQPPVAAYWLRTAGATPIVSIDHNLTLNKQGGSVPGNEFYHLTAAEKTRVEDAEYTIQIANENPNVAVNGQLLIAQWDITTFRAAKIMMTIEDNGPGNMGTVFTELTLMFDGNYPYILEFGEIGNILTNSVTFVPDQDINNINLYVESTSTDMSFYMRVKVFNSFDDIQPPLTPNNDLLPSDSLVSDLP